MVYLNQLLEKYQEKGFRIVAVSPEGADVIQKVFVTEFKAKYWIGSDDQFETLRSFVVPKISSRSASQIKTTWEQRLRKIKLPHS